MKLAVFSYKICWRDSASPSGYVTDGGFPFQMRSLSELFDQTRLVLTVSEGRPRGATPLTGHHLEVAPLPTPSGSDFRRKLSMLFWLPQFLPRIVREVRAADAVHTPVPGDVGAIGLLVALWLRKPIFVRHCGTWGEPVTAADRWLLRLLEHIAGGRNVVMATGGAKTPPSARNASVSWIFSTSISAAEIEAMPRCKPWRVGEAPRLVTVGRLTKGKNAAAAIQALTLVRERHPSAALDVVGDGVCRQELETLATELGLSKAVTFHGNVDHERVLEILASSHLFVFPTQVKEGFPKAVLEAVACGLPVVATAVSVIPMLIEGCGVALKATDPSSVAQAILQLLKDDQQLAQMSELGRAKSREYTLERWQESIAERLRSGWGLPIAQREFPASN